MARPDTSDARLDALARQATASTRETYEVIQALLEIAHAAPDRSLEAALADAEARASRAEAMVVKLEKRLAEARQQIEHGTRAPGPAAPAENRLRGSVVAASEARPEAASAAETLAEAFQAWCRTAGAVVGKASFFAGAVAEALPGTALTVVYRDGNAQAVPVALNASGGALPVEYWALAYDGRHWLLPQPLSGSQFRELEPCFDGEATPETLRHVRPAELRAAGGGFELVRKGRASA